MKYCCLEPKIVYIYLCLLIVGFSSVNPLQPPSIRKDEYITRKGGLRVVDS